MTSPAIRMRTLRRRLERRVARGDFYPRLEIGFAAAAVLLGVGSYAVLNGQGAPAEGFSPALITALLVANLVPLMALIILIARRLTVLLTNRREGRAGSRLHVRLVALFATIAAVPTLLVVVFASLLFQFGVQFWFSDRVKTVLENADQVARAYVDENKQRVEADVVAMGGDINGAVREVGLTNPTLGEVLGWQVAARNLTEGALFTPDGRNYVIHAQTEMDARPLRERFLALDLERARGGEAVVIASAADRIEAIVRIDPLFERYIYVSRRVDPQVLSQVAQGENALSEYRSLTDRSRQLQWQFNLMLIVVSLLILAVAISLALWLANRIVSPIGRLASAAERVGAGDLSARVPVRNSPDEVGTLERSFNRMTTQLEAQQGALKRANQQLDLRRQFTEAVLSGVSAGVLSIDAEGAIRLANRSAAELLELPETELAGASLVEAVPELADLMDEARRAGHARGQVRIARGSDTQTLAVRAAAETGSSGGYVLTFDDISQQLADQRRAAWADVARRIAHEIKNPLTPIQLSAERLKRKYSRQITEDLDVFTGLTDTIVRQVGDLRRMVDEFSSFARMPKPVFRAEPVLDVARQALFLHEVGHPAIAFELDVPDALPVLVCDRRQISQALTNLLKNAAEAVEAKGIDDGRVRLSIEVAGDRLTITVADNGCGLPAELRDRITEPYVTTRTRGTGLGLAIVKKIVEEHQGVLDLADAPDGGTVARMNFDLRALADRMEGEGEAPLADDDRMMRRG